MTTTTTAAASSDRVPRAVPAIVDCDAHNFPAMPEITPYLAKRWGDYLDRYGIRTPSEQGVVRARWMGSRTDAWGPSGKPPGSDPEFFVEQLVDAYDIDRVILNNVIMQTRATLGFGQPQELTNAMMHAANQWAKHDWLGYDERFFASICVPNEDGASTVAEIERWAGDPRFVQVSLPFRMDQPLGHRKYRPMIEAAVAHDLPLAFHPGLGGGAALTGVSWPSFYYEDHVNLPQALMNHMASLVCEGVFDRHPNLKIVVQEGGWSWVPAFCWRFDRAWKQLRSEIPSLQRKPSEYIREHFWFTTQPIEEPKDRSHLLEAIELLDMSDRLMFSSDYPHWDFDAPDAAIPSYFPEDLRRKIMAGNAVALYPALTRPAR